METERNYKDRLIRMIFTKDKKSLLSLYNAVNKTAYTNEEELTITTLENAIYMGMKNDISFVFGFSLNLYEHQSTWNPNMPLRNLFYLSKVLQVMVADKNLYGRVLIKIPTPQFVVFYNGLEKIPEKLILRLSDAFEKPVADPEIELTVTLLNINPGNNPELMESCRLLKEYGLYVEKVRMYAKSMLIEDAVNRAVDECIKENILADFLSRYKAEVIEVSIFEYDEELHMSQERKAAREEGWEEGHAEGKILHLITLVDKKLQKNLNADEIADILEEEPSIIETLIQLILDNPEKTQQELAHLYLSK